MRKRRINVKREMKTAIQMKINILMEEVRVIQIDEIFKVSRTLEKRIGRKS